MMEIILLPSVLFFCMVLCFLVIGFSSYYRYEIQLSRYEKISPVCPSKFGLIHNFGALKKEYSKVLKRKHVFGAKKK